MPLNRPPSKLVRVVVAPLIGAAGIASIQACHSRKDRHTEQPSDRQAARKPLIQDRAATKSDFDSGVAIFCVQGGRSAPYSLGHNLPIRAEVVKAGVGSWEIGHRVSIVQAEITDGQHVTLGVIDGDEDAVCSLADVRLLE